jgi:hypothetical protein
MSAALVFLGLFGSSARLVATGYPFCPLCGPLLERPQLFKEIPAGGSKQISVYCSLYDPGFGEFTQTGGEHAR